MESSQPAQGYQFGTFKGVYTPSILTLLGVIMYLRLGWVLGQAGLTGTLVIITLSSCITFLTGLSLAALATNMRIGGGGAYFIISRSLGMEIGAAVGIPLFLAQAIGVSFYIAGFSEAFVHTFPAADMKIVSIATLLLLSVLAYYSADLSLKSQFLIMAIIAVSLVSFFLGSGDLPPTQEAVTEGAAALKTNQLGFWVLFAVFFPAVTGIEAGIAMSGDLKNPTRSLPIGTILAVITAFLIYAGIAIFLDWKVENKTLLLKDPLIMQKVAWSGEIILLGIWAASLSSAMGSMLGAPRTLQALAQDGVLPEAVGRGYGKTNEPRAATAICFLIALAGVLLGDLDLIAPVLSMFFLTSYGILNLSAGMGQLISNPSWRPKFRVPAWISLLGFLGCVGVMIQINFGATLASVLVAAGIYYLMKRRSLKARWGDPMLGVLMFFAGEVLYRMAGKKMDAHSWQPNILLLSGPPTSRWYLVELADAISRGRSFLTVGTMVPEKACTQERIDKITETIREFLQKRHIRAFVRTFPASDPIVGAQALIKAYGFGPVTPNTILIGETENPERFVEYARMIKLVSGMRRNLIMVRTMDEPPAGKGQNEGLVNSLQKRKEIHIWWSGSAVNASFMLAVAHLVSLSRHWTASIIVLKKVLSGTAEKEQAAAQMQEFLEGARIQGRTETLICEDGDVFKLIRESSKTASLVFLGVRPPATEESVEDYSLYYTDLLNKTEGIPMAALVIASERIDFGTMFKSIH
jgi:solute carrier family 12 (sodium/potassium/chloride transporter), member 2